MSIEYSIAEAKNRLPSVVHQAEQGELVHITRRGRPVAVILSEAAYEQLSRESHPGVWEAIQSFRADYAADIAEITDNDFAGLRDNSTGRNAAWE